jgi:hypothetical protein
MWSKHVSDNDCRRAPLVNRILFAANKAQMTAERISAEGCTTRFAATRRQRLAKKSRKKKSIPRNDFMLVTIAPGPRVW